MGVAREDKAARLALPAISLFQCPVGMFFSLDKQMQEGQWSDMGMLIQTMMLLARERGCTLARKRHVLFGADGQRIFGHSRQPYFFVVWRSAMPTLTHRSTAWKVCARRWMKSSLIWVFKRCSRHILAFGRFGGLRRRLWRQPAAACQRPKKSRFGDTGFCAAFRASGLSDHWQS